MVSLDEHGHTNPYDNVRNTSQSELFQGCEDPDIWDLAHKKHAFPFPCRHRGALLGRLVSELTLYDVIRSCFDFVPPEEMHTRNIDAVRQLAIALEFLQHSKKSLHAARTQRGRKQIKTLKSSLRDLTEMITSLTPEQYQCDHSADTAFIVARMYQAFLEYGPSDRRYNHVSIRHALAAILIHVGIEEGSRSHVHDRLRKIEERSTASQKR